MLAPIGRVQARAAALLIFAVGSVASACGSSSSAPDRGNDGGAATVGSGDGGSTAGAGGAGASANGGGGAGGVTSELSIGAAAVRQRPYAMAPPTGTLTTSPVETQASGSVLLASAARGTWAIAPDPPTDNRANGFELADAAHPYAAWPTSRTGLYAATDAAGGPDHTFSLTWGDIGGTGDEVTLSVVEVRGAASIEDESWVEQAAGSSLASGPVTTSGPSLLVAWWWGSGGVKAAGEMHVAVPGDGFTIVPEATALTSLGLEGYVQVAVAYRVVPEAGTYTVSWSTDDEGAQLYLVALR